MTTKVFVRNKAEHVITFGPDKDTIRNAYVLIKGCDAEQAREIMFAVHGRDWCTLYSDADKDRILADTRYNLVQVIEVGGEWTAEV